MGCTSSISRSCSGGKKKKLSVSEVVVFVPTMRVPVELDLVRPLRGIVCQDLVERLSSLRSRIVLLAQDNGGSDLTELQQALDEYLPVLIGLTRKEYHLEEMVNFTWKNLGDGQVTSIASSWYELLSVIHMMAVLSLSEVNLMLVPKDSIDACERKVAEDGKKAAIDLLLKASGYLDYCAHYVLVQMQPDIKRNLPRDLQEGVLEAISVEALGQGIEMQLGLAVESQKATSSVKRRLACEQVSYFSQAHYCFSGCDSCEGYGKKHILFIKWKYLEAKAAAYYYHGLILDKGNEPNSHINAVCCLLAAEELLIDSKRACLSFNLASPVTRTPPFWGVMKHLHQKIPEVASKKSQMYHYLFDQDKVPQALLDLPDFPLSLKPDDYELPEIDSSWDSEKCEPLVQTLKEHLEDEDGDTEINKIV